MAEYLGYEFLDAAELGEVPASTARWIPDATYEALRSRSPGDRSVVIPGFYGVMPDGRIRTFSRGGSDITGALAAAALDADVYENWTDVSGILMADPRIVDDPEPIRHVTYGELRELSYIGAQVLHEGTIFPVREKNIPLNIRNTNEPGAPRHHDSREPSSDDIERRQLHHRHRRARRASPSSPSPRPACPSEPGTLAADSGSARQARGQRGVHPLRHRHRLARASRATRCPSCLYAMLGELQKEVQPNKITVTEHIAVVAAVGRKMAYRPGVSGKIFAKLGENGVNIRMITQGPEELNIIVGVEEKDFEQAIRVLYDSFVKEHI